MRAQWQVALLTSVESAQLLPSLAATVRARNALPLDTLLEVTATSKLCSQTLIFPTLFDNTQNILNYTS